MSNGTRIDPEEREPRAIKIRQPKKHKGLKIFLCVFSAVAVIAAGTLAFVLFGDNIELPKIGFFDSEKEEKLGESFSEPEVPENPSEPEIPEEPESVPDEQPEIPAEPEVPSEPEEQEEPEPQKPEIPKDEWYMLLVNRENPLPEDFMLEGAAIDENGHLVDARIFNDLSEMIAAGKAEGLRFTLYTAYRTIQKQNELFAAGKTDVPGGASEHNCGLAVDIGNSGNADFEGSPEQNWLLEHAHEYGFILRYPKGKEDITGFAHEPWHFRYVGKEQAVLIKESGLCLEEYLAQE